MNKMEIEEIKKMDEHVIYSWKVQGKTEHIIMDHAEGVFMWDVYGKRYYDYCSGLLGTNLGHGNKHVLEAMKKQMDKLCYVSTSFATEVKARLAKSIADVTPGDLDYVFFVNGGAEANENAIKTVRWFTGRNKIYSTWRSYHGATAGAISITGEPRRWVAEPGIPGCTKFFGPYCYRCPFGYESKEKCGIQCLKVLETQIMLDGPETIAAIFMEPITGTNGIIIPPLEYVKGVRELCDRYGILLVADEVMSAWGRTGKWFAMEHYGVVPDIITTAKGLTSCYAPLGAMIWSKRVYECFTKRPFVGGLTFSGHALACAAGVAAIEEYKRGNVIERAAEMENYMTKKLLKLKEEHPSIGDVRNKGLFGCIELTADREKKEPLAGYNDCKMNVMNELTKRMLDNGVYVFAKWDFIFIAPPLIITKEQIDEATDIIGKALEYTDSLVKKKETIKAR